MTINTRTILASLLALAAISIQGCTTISQEGKEVQVLSQNSELLLNCKKLGRVSAEVSIFGGAVGVSTYQSVEDQLRNAAYQEYKADTVVVTNFDDGTFSIAGQGYAMNCDQ